MSLTRTIICYDINSIKDLDKVCVYVNKGNENSQTVFN